MASKVSSQVMSKLNKGEFVSVIILFSKGENSRTVELLNEIGVTGVGIMGTLSIAVGVISTIDMADKLELSSLIVSVAEDQPIRLIR